MTIEKNPSLFPKPDDLSAGEKLLPSKDLQVLFNNLDITTEPEAQQELLKDKISFLQEILESKELSVEILKNYPTVYIASNDDFQYPLLLGARHLKMVDPKFSVKENVQIVVEKLKDMFPDKAIDLKGTIISFDFDFGAGSEKVEMELVGEVYESYTEPENVGLWLAYRSQQVPIDDEAIYPKLVPGGMILVDNATMSFSELIEAKEKMKKEDTLNLSEDELMKKIYERRGYTYIPISTGKEKGWKKTFLRKK